MPASSTEVALIVLLVVILGVAIFATLNWPSCWSGGRNALYPAGATATTPTPPQIFDAVTAQSLVAQPADGLDGLAAERIGGFPGGFMPINQAISTEAAAMAGFQLMAGSLINNPEELVDVRGVSDFAAPGPGATGQWGMTRDAQTVASKYRKAAGGHRVKGKGNHTQDGARDKPHARHVGVTGTHHLIMNQMAEAARTGKAPATIRPSHPTNYASTASDGNGLPKTQQLGSDFPHPSSSQQYVIEGHAPPANDKRGRGAPVGLNK